jgi:hypothetical protein
VDLFASHANHQLPVYYSRYFTPSTSGVDAFRFSWGRSCWANPPFHLILRVLKHTEACKARMCLIAPFWPTRDWWPFITADGVWFRSCILGARVLGRASDLFLPNPAGDPAPKSASRWSVLALLVDFTANPINHIRVPADPVAPRPRTDLNARAEALLAALGAGVDPELSALASQYANEADHTLDPRTSADYTRAWDHFRGWWAARQMAGSVYDTPGEAIALYLLSSAAISSYFRLAGRSSPTEHPACDIVRDLAEKQLQGRRLERDALEPTDVAALALETC